MSEKLVPVNVICNCPDSKMMTIFVKDPDDYKEISETAEAIRKGELKQPMSYNETEESIIKEEKTCT